MKMKKKWYRIGLPYSTKRMIRRANDFEKYLISNNIKYKVRVLGFFAHFEFLLLDKDLESVNAALNKIVWFDSVKNM